MVKYIAKEVHYNDHRTCKLQRTSKQTYQIIATKVIM
jgi:hypothetical protein